MSELNDVMRSSIIPSYASVEESALYVVESAEADFNQLMMNIGLNELGVLESTGTQMVYEAGNIKKLVDSVVEFIKKQWAKVMELVNKALNDIKGQAEKFKAKVVGAVDKKQEATKANLKKKVSKLKDTDKDGKAKEFGKTYSYDFTAVTTGKLISTLENYQGSLSTSFRKLMDSPSIDTDNMKADFEQAKKYLTSQVAGKEDATLGEIKKAVVDAVRGAEVVVDKKYIEDNFDEMFDNCTNYGKCTKEIKTTFGQIKKRFDTDIKTVKGTKENKETVVSTFLPFMKYGENVATTVTGAAVSCVREKLFNDMKLIMKVAVAAVPKKEKKEEVKQESTVLESSTFQTELASLFNF